MTCVCVCCPPCRRGPPSSTTTLPPPCGAASAPVHPRPPSSSSSCFARVCSVVVLFSVLSLPLSVSFGLARFPFPLPARGPRRKTPPSGAQTRFPSCEHSGGGGGKARMRRCFVCSRDLARERGWVGGESHRVGYSTAFFSNARVPCTERAGGDTGGVLLPAMPRWQGESSRCQAHLPFPPGAALFVFLRCLSPCLVHLLSCASHDGRALPMQVLERVHGMRCSASVCVHVS